MGGPLLTIKPGTSENLISESMTPQCPTPLPAGSKGGLLHTAAIETALPNNGNSVMLKASEGRHGMLKVQATDDRRLRGTAHSTTKSPTSGLPYFLARCGQCAQVWANSRCIGKLLIIGLEQGRVLTSSSTV